MTFRGFILTVLLSFRRQLHQHIKKEHRSVKEWSCTKCTRYLSQVDDLILHRSLQHEKNEFKCTIEGCDFVSRLRQGTIDHFNAKHCPVQCDQCRVWYDSRVMLTRMDEEAAAGRSAKRKYSSICCPPNVSVCPWDCFTVNNHHKLRWRDLYSLNLTISYDNKARKTSSLKLIIVIIAARGTLWGI